MRSAVRANGHAWIGGWLRAPVALGAALQLRLVIDGGTAHAAHAEWYLEGPTSDLVPGMHTLAAVATDARGVEHCFDAAPLELARPAETLDSRAQ